MAFYHNIKENYWFITIIILIPLIISIILGNIGTNLKKEEDKKLKDNLIIASWALGAPYILIGAFIIFRFIVGFFIKDNEFTEEEVNDMFAISERAHHTQVIPK